MGAGGNGHDGTGDAGQPPGRKPNGIDWPAISRYFKLSPRELAVLQGAFAGRKWRDMAREFGGSHHTVDSHWRKVKEKMGVATILEAVHKIYTMFPPERGSDGPKSTRTAHPKI
jgi:DNA-binding NarL/FixJ family response regulator